MCLCVSKKSYMELLYQNRKPLQVIDLQGFIVLFEVAEGLEPP